MTRCEAAGRRPRGIQSLNRSIAIQEKNALWDLHEEGESDGFNTELRSNVVVTVGGLLLRHPFQFQFGVKLSF